MILTEFLVVLYADHVRFHPLFSEKRNLLYISELMNQFIVQFLMRPSR